MFVLGLILSFFKCPPYDLCHGCTLCLPCHICCYMIWSRLWVCGISAVRTMLWSIIWYVRHVTYVACLYHAHDVTYALGTVMPAMHVIYVVGIWYMPAMWLKLRVLSLYHISTMKVIYAMVIMLHYICHFSNSKLRLSQITYWNIFGAFIRSYRNLFFTLIPIYSILTCIFMCCRINYTHALSVYSYIYIYI